MIGSTLDMASSEPERIAAIAADAVPTPMIATSLAVEPLLGEHVEHHAIGARSGRGHADLHALEVLGRLVMGGLRLGDAYRNRGVASHEHETLQLQPLGLLVDGVFPRASNDVGTAADHCLQRLRAAVEIADFDFEPLVLEIAQALSDGERQIVELRFAADRDAHLRLLGFALRRSGEAAATRTASRRSATARLRQCFIHILLLPDRCGSRGRCAPSAARRSGDAHIPRRALSTRDAPVQRRGDAA